MSVRHLAHPQGDLTFFRELARIAQEVEQNLLEPQGVRSERAHVLRRFDNKAVFVLLGELSRGADDVIDKPRQSSGLSSSLPASIFERSRTSLMRLSRW